MPKLRNFVKSGQIGQLPVDSNLLPGKAGFLLGYISISSKISFDLCLIRTDFLIGVSLWHDLYGNCCMNISDVT